MQEITTLQLAFQVQKPTALRLMTLASAVLVQKPFIPSYYFPNSLGLLGYIKPWLQATESILLK